MPGVIARISYEEALAGGHMMHPDVRLKALARAKGINLDLPYDVWIDPWSRDYVVTQVQSIAQHLNMAGEIYVV